MPKQKTHKGLAKRVKVTGTGKVLRRRAGSGHLMSSKSGKRCRNLRQTTGMSRSLNNKTIAALAGG
ncbi:MAG: 50S ribosomal protein L35 [Sedimentisphaerales bacterium]|nr:50S ribosomal protein L35 [Sedimentisphaerales bacterium]